MKDLVRKMEEYQEIVRRTQVRIYFLKKKEEEGVNLSLEVFVWM
jgi:hypothetical protein